jgi:hypothetical protein
MSESKVINDVLLFSNINHEEEASIVGGLRWVAGSNGSVPKGAVNGGSATGYPKLYICRFYHENGTHPGKLVGKKCNIGWGGKEITSSNYQVLVD